MNLGFCKVVTVDDPQRDRSLEHQIGGSKGRHPGCKCQHCSRESVWRWATSRDGRPGGTKSSTSHSTTAASRSLIRPQFACAPGVQLYCDDSGASVKQRQSKGTGADTEIDDQIARADARASNDRSAQYGSSRCQPIAAARTRRTTKIIIMP